MVDRNLLILGVLIFIGFVLNTVGVFTPYWVVDSFGFHGGITHIDQYTETWFLFATVFMYFSFLQFAFTFLIYLYTLIIVYRNGYSQRVRKWFKLMANNSGTIVMFTVIALILMGVNFSKASGPADTYRLGYSAWLSCAAAVLSLGNVILAMVIAENECK
ncbi:hypothetical protein B9Z55_009947 [Caenorhabditis nigoni]|uniref:Serpentine receptor class gamma n=1 Tax=Caenorhabditis nigoni TaxID=1611254 RepID=A0A2G5UU44_9PELO|nr:hypothetical protein B9Z55_009947 [Caenorhabditis nigoni]